MSDDIDVTLVLMKQMYGVGPDGVTDSGGPFDYWKAVSGTIYFVPSFEALLWTGTRVGDQP